MKKNFRTIGIAATLATGALLLSACSTGTTGTSEPLAKSDTSTSANGWNADEAMLISDYEYEFGPIGSDMENSLVELGYTVCDSLDAGLTFDDILYSSQGTGMDPYEAGYIVGAAVADLCPTYVGDMDDYLNSNGYSV